MNRLFLKPFAVSIMLFSLVATVMAEEQVEEIEVSDTQTLASPTISSSVITAEDLEGTTARNAADALRNIPGVTVVEGGRRNRTRVSIRGFNPRYVRVFIDGVPLNPASDESVDLSMIPVEVIERIEVIRGPAPVRYGSNAMAGVILITTKRGSKRKGVTTTLNASAVEAEDSYTEWMGNHADIVEPENATYNSMTLDIGGGGTAGDFEAYTLARMHTSEGVGPHSENRHFSFWENVGYSPAPWLKLSLTGSYINGYGDLMNPDRKLERIGGYGGGTGSGTGPGANSSDWRIDLSDKYHIGLNARALGANWSARALAYYYGDYSDYRLVKPGDAGVESMSYRESIAWGGDASFEYSFEIGPTFNTVMIGVSGGVEEFDWSNSIIVTEPWALFGESAKRTTGGVYGEYIFKPIDSLTMIAGARYDARFDSSISLDVADSDGEDGVFSPHFSFLWEPTRGLDFHGAAARTFRFPRLRDTYDYAYGNPALKPESAWDYEMGLSYSPVEPLIFKLSGYRNDIENLIYSPGRFIQFMNIGEARIWGFEAEVEGMIKSDGFFRKTTLVANYTYMDGYDLTNDRVMPYAPKHKVDAAALMDFPRGFNLSVIYGWIDERVTGDALTPKLDAYDTINVKFGIKRERFSAWVGAENIFDASHQENLGYYRPGRTWIAGAKHTF